ncbi:MAG: hypothetical protein ABSA02_43565 [Trebonia sp.]
MAAGELTESWARTICGRTCELPEDCQDTADDILAGAARGGMDLRDLAALALCSGRHSLGGLARSRCSRILGITP